jgi:hypothetical protein
VTFLLKASHPKRGRNSVLTTDDLQVRFRHKVKPTGKQIGGLFTEVTDAGVDRKHLELYPREGRTGDGRRAHSPWARNEADATGAGVKQVLRRLRPQEAEQLAAIDARLEEAKRALDEIRDERDEAVRGAFSKGHVVTVSELTQMAERHEQQLSDQRGSDSEGGHGA